MNRLKNYKRLEICSEDAYLAKDELKKILHRYRMEMEEKLTDLVMQSYHNSISEIERRRLIERAGSSIPRIEFFLQAVLSYSFVKIHRGSKLKAYELLDEIKDAVFKMGSEEIP